jgi:hypothetical protein
MGARLKKKNGLSEFCVIFFFCVVAVVWNLLHRESKVEERELLNLIDEALVVVDVVLQRTRAFEKKIGAYR